MDLKHILKEMERHAIDKEKIFANIFEKGIVTAIYKELSKFSKKTNLI